MKTRVVFRQFKEGDVIALFPEFTHSKSYTITAYQHIGQHCEVDPQVITAITKPAKEFHELLKELQGIYKGELSVGQRLNVRWQ